MASYSYATFTTTYSEPGRQLCVETASGQSCGPRQIQIGTFYPALASGSNPVPYRGYDALPLVIFAPGFDEFYSNYLVMIQAMVRSGFVVVALNFPRTNPDADGGLFEGDILNQPGDISQAINWALSASQTSSSPLYRLIDSTKIAVAGQSDGGDTALALVYNSCCIDSRVKAAVIFSGAELASYPGSYFPAGVAIPLLVIQGSADVINPPAASTQIFAQAPVPKYLLWLPGADHISPYTVQNPYEAAVASVTGDFLQGYLESNSSALAKMATDGNVASVATLTSN